VDLRRTRGGDRRGGARFNLLGDALRDALDPRHAAKSATIEAPPSART